MSSVITDQDLALKLADAADEISLARFRALDLRVEAKPDASPVTDADRSVEERLRAILQRHRPEDAIIGEEFANQGEAARTWIIDPIDGTANYLRGIPIWASLIALRVDDVITTSVVSAPALGRRWWAQRGNGAFTKEIDGNIRLVETSKVSELAASSISYNSLQLWDQAGKLDELVALSRQVWRTRAFGDFLSYMYLAEGALEMVSEHDLKLYDIAALVPIVEEAGGTFTAIDGPLTADSSSVLATNTLMHDEFMKALS
ncbi:MAG TPA: inositol monophosphatase family protein [Aquiluna sp.]